MRLHHDERGQTIIVVALSLPFLLGFIGMATDVGALFKDKRTIQTAADAAAIAGALNLSRGTYLASGKAAAKANGFTDGSNGVIVNVVNGPTWANSNYKGASGYIEATVTKTEPTIFLALFGYPSVNVLARAVATSSGPSSGCIYTLGPTGTTLTISGNLDLTGCGINVDSSDASAMNGGGAAVNASVGIVGGCSDCSTFVQAPVTGIVPFSDPLSYLPQYSCTNSGCACVSNCANNPVTNMPTSCVAAVGGALSPGCYNGLAIGKGTLTLNPGVYFINGNITMSGGATFNGSGVTLILASGSLNMTTTDTMNLMASGVNTPFPGLLYYQVVSDPNVVQLAGSASTLQGIFYAPSASLTLQGFNGANVYTGFVVQSLSASGSTSYTNYASAPNAAGGITSVALVE